ncbi:DM13 domain-containing protein [Candidatus Uhrbacteria bacterium]|nr:DM13 domain-containing protein [Candidatus Uhrbacteria bacterium]
MKKMAVTSLVLAVALMGAGCLGVPKYSLGDMPSEEQLALMDDQEKVKAIEAFMEKNPVPEPSEDEKRQELKESIDTMMGGTAERMGDFVGKNFHNGEGIARIVKVGAMYRIVLSEEFSVTPGPYLVVKAGELEVGPLKSFRGTQTFDLPKGFDLSQAPYISIFCKPFQVEFARATFN